MATKPKRRANLSLNQCVLQKLRMPISQALFLKPPEYLLCLMIFSRGVQSFCQKKLEPFGAKCPLRVLPGDTFAPCGQSRKSRRSCPGTTLCQGSQFGNTNATKLMHLMLYLFGQLAKLSIGAIRSIPCKMIQSRNIGICCVGCVLSRCRVHRSFSVSETVETLCVTTVVSGGR